jgi:peptidoglycan/xylan/chitin deacetylase (PgdA/CDA1 family)
VAEGGGKVRTHAVAGWAAGGVAAVLLLHAGPGVVGLEVVRRSMFPALAGVGRADHVALTFDDGPNPNSTPAILEALDALGWRATFFMLGARVRRAPQLAAEVAAAGHEIGLHGDEHRNLLKSGPVSTVREVHRGLETVAEATGQPPRWFRPPYGALSATALLAARSLKLQPVLWTTCGNDWSQAATPASVAATVRAGLIPGATIVLHDSAYNSDPDTWRSTLGALPLLAIHFEAAGLAVGPLGEHDRSAGGTPR